MFHARSLGTIALTLTLATLPAGVTMALEPFGAVDFLDLETASDPRISPDGSQVVFVRRSVDVMRDRYRSGLWMVPHGGGETRPLGESGANESSPRWSPDGRKLLFLSDRNGKPQLFLRWMDSGQVAQLTFGSESPADPAWSPDGRWIAFSMAVPDPTEPFVKMPAKPEGAEWNREPNTIRRLIYRRDGAGYLEEAHSQLFVLPVEGGTPRQLTRGPRDHGGPLAWSPDGRSIVFGANLVEEPDLDPLESEIHEISLADGSIRTLTSRNGPDAGPALSPDGRQIAWLGFEDREQGYQVTRLYLMARDGSGQREITTGLDRDIESLQWDAEGKGLYFLYDDAGNTRLAHTTLAGKLSDLARDVGGTSHGRPYPGGSFDVARGGQFAFTMTRPEHPADIAAGRRGSREIRRLTRLNDDVFATRALGEVEEIRYASSFDSREIQGWILKPPGFDANRKYPMILEIHGGPFANYGDRFSSEMQAFAGAGYVVLYTNPRGSTSYGEAFGNLIHHAYPGNDYEDLVSGVDALIALGYVDPRQLYVTGGSGGGVLTAWIIGKTDRFRAAVSSKPVINWASFALTADNPAFFTRYWFGKTPWEAPQAYWDRSPLALVGNVKTPTMVLTGEADYRTPMSESEQYFAALKLRGVDAALVRIPDASHGMDARPSQLAGKVLHILKWFEMHAAPGDTDDR
jgi:acylaminoacyl-peptidase